MKIRFLVPVIGMVVAIGCSPTSRPSVEKPPTSKPIPATAPTAEVPVKLHHDGFVYGGFAKEGTQTFVVKVSGQADGEGTETKKVKPSTDGTILIERSRDGALAAVGTDTVRIDDKGASVVGVSIGKLSAPSLELPANLAIGKTWKLEYNIKTDTETIKNAGTYKVVGDGPVSVPAGKFTARKVTLTGTIETSKGRGKVTSTFYFVKNMGAVKSETTITFNGQTPQTFVLELKK